MPGPDPTPEGASGITFFLDPRTLVLIAIIVVLAGIVIYLLNR